jgi:hypothetical protein
MWPGPIIMDVAPIQRFCDDLDPSVVILQGLFSDPPRNETMELLSHHDHDHDDYCWSRIFLTTVSLESESMHNPSRP